MMSLFTWEYFAAAMERTFYNEAELRAFAGEFARSLRAGDVVALSGPLGSGKTTFVKAVAAALLGSDPVTSPTFTFRHRYGGATPIEHLDFYRIEHPDELDELGLEEAFDGSAIVMIEWWDNAPEAVPLPRYEITLEGSGDSPRRLALRRQ